MALKDNLMPALQDREISESAQDKFGHVHFAKGLESLIESPTNIPPFSIGLLGGWGTGKSSVKSLYLNQLKDDLSKGGDKLKRSERVKYFTFNAWRYGGNEADIKRALLRHIYIELGGDEKVLKDELFHEVTKSENSKRSWKDYFSDFIDNFLCSLVALAFLLGLYIGGVAALLHLFPDNEWVQVASIFAPAVLLSWIAKTFADPRKFISSRLSSMTKVELPRTTTEEYEDLLIQQLAVFKRSPIGKKCQRLVVFIDDLDRLSSDEMVCGLDAVRTFMEMPKNKVPEGLGIVFVISCDETRIATALAARNKDQCSAEIPGVIHTLADARRYLDRIFQFRLKIPPTPKQDMRQFAIDHLENELAELKADLEARGTSIPALVDRMIHVGVDNPRKAKQILNAFAQSWWIASIREHEGISSNRAGALCKGSVTDHPVSLAALCALRVDFPDFYRQLQQYPSLIDRFRAVFRREEPLSEQPTSAQDILIQYSVGESNRVKKEYRPLRQYLASLDGHQWPQSIEPLLLLTQDPVSRAYPDGAHHLYESLVSGDVQGVLEEFSLHLDDRQMTLEQITMLRDLLENCGQESTERQERSAFVVASLANKVPNAYSGLLLNPLCSQLAFSAALRWRVGLPGIKNIIFKCDKEHRQPLCVSIINDFLLPSGNIEFKNTSGQTPTLKEAENLAQIACEIALDIREEFGLPSAANAQLLDWLYARRVQIDGEEEILPFATLEKWVSLYGGSLFPDFNEQYLELLNEEIKNERTDSFDINSALARAESIFVSLWESGKEGQSVFWDELTKLIAVRDNAAIDLGMGLVSKYHSTATSGAISDFTKAYIVRLDKEMDDEEKWKLDYKRAARLLIEVINAHISKIGESTLSALPELVSKYLTTTSTDSFGTELLDLLKEFDDGLREKSLEEILPVLLTEGTQRTIEWISSNSIETLSGKESEALWGHVAAEIESAIPSGETAKRYKWFIGGMPPLALDDGKWENHTLGVFSFLNQQRSNLNYIERVLPIVAPLLGKGLLAEIGSSLQGLVANNNGNPTNLSPIHRHLMSYWPTRDQGFTGYNPDTIFSQGLHTISQHQGNPLCGDILKSIAMMVVRKVVPQDGNKQLVIDKACEMWPSHRSASEFVLSQEGIVPSSSQVANLMDQLDLTKEDDYEQLKSIWSVLAVRLIPAEQSETANNIVQKQLQQGPAAGIKDAGLVAWIDALSRSESKAFVLKQCVVNGDFPEEARRRVWAQIIANSSDLQKGFFVELLPKLFAEQDVQTLQADILASVNAINSRFADGEDKRELNKAILSALLQSPSEKMKFSLAKWLSSNRGGGVVKSVGSMNPSMEDLKALKEVFPSSKTVKELIKKAE